MSRGLSLVNTAPDFDKIEKRILPRFPLNHLTFRLTEDDSAHHTTFEIKDISFSGMQIERKLGDVMKSKGDTISGVISWFGEKCAIQGKVVWLRDKRMGIHFDDGAILREKISNFLNIENFVGKMKALHQEKYGIKRPNGLRYWLKADGAAEIFVWSSDNSEVAKFQIIVLGSFVEWIQGEGMRTGEVVSRRDTDIPLISEDEFAFHLDNEVSMRKIYEAHRLMENIPEQYMDNEISEFIIRNLRVFS
ncbi:MAG: PilZ domain-containing protein [Halobacteriovoraceae bacterium]|nr:PilZ domain-containing protein [Halobacteriovoraceae bacterium]MCB9095180.1 PilZ domain-containing protein [Halobacteriovoraceae bacterium]